MRFLDASYSETLSNMAWEICEPYYRDKVDRTLLKHYLDTFQSKEAIFEQISEMGYLYSMITDESGETVGYFALCHKGDVLFLSKFYIEERFRGKGFGSGTLDEIFEYGRSLGFRCVQLQANRNNTPSIEIYKAKGFIVVATDDSDIGNGIHVDDLVMEYDLQE